MSRLVPDPEPPKISTDAQTSDDLILARLMDSAALKLANDDQSEVHLHGARFVCLPSGCLLWPDQDLLIVSDLHLETGSSYAGRGQLVPPYDTGATLKRLSAEVEAHQPKNIICLGDSFHDCNGSLRLTPESINSIQALQKGRDWIWIAGNHDPEAPNLAGDVAQELAIGAVTFRHEPSMALTAGEICGHLHPAARVNLGVRRVKRRCFVADLNRLMLPAFGTYTGGFNIAHRAFHGLFERQHQQVWLLGEGRVFRFPAKMAVGI